jgi:apolipoprotein N-acyltransferase
MSSVSGCGHVLNAMIDQQAGAPCANPGVIRSEISPAGNRVRVAPALIGDLDCLVSAARLRKVAEGKRVQRASVALPIQLVLALLSGLLLAFSYGLHPLWWAAWAAPAPIIVAVLAAPRSRRRLLGLVTGLVAGIATTSYHAAWAGWPVALLILALRALGWASAVQLTARAAERWPAPVVVFVLPIAWAALETLITLVSPHGSAGSLAYSQMDFLHVVQIASIGGVPAIVFTVLLFGSFAGLLLARLLGVWKPRGMFAAGGAVALILAAVFGYGQLRLNQAPDPVGATVSLITIDRLTRQPTDWPSFLSVYGPPASKAASPGSILVLPEAVAVLEHAEAEAASLQLARFARERQVNLVVGMVVENGASRTNRALMVHPSGTRAWYSKQHLVPGFEDSITPGTALLVQHSPVARTGVAICKDMHFPSLGRAYADAGVRLMIVPASDSKVDDWMAARITALRGVEGGYTVARAARQGFSSVSDRFGRFTAQQRSGAVVRTLSAAVPIPPGGVTPYTRFGDAFGWSCVLALALILFWARASRRRRSGGPGLQPTRSDAPALKEAA